MRLLIAVSFTMLALLPLGAAEPAATAEAKDRPASKEVTQPAAPIDDVCPCPATTVCRPTLEKVTHTHHCYRCRTKTICLPYCPKGCGKKCDGCACGKPRGRRAIQRAELCTAQRREVAVVEHFGRFAETLERGFGRHDGPRVAVIKAIVHARRKIEQLRRRSGVRRTRCERGDHDGQRLCQAHGR